ncbi:MAG: 4'-phosphopantetheinyl transferase superfamily protein [Gorillibacterium sp.]|nr:4'-phosphopantetheinyl transferase superfamily protein [Gorillibacterium sp.]
MEITICFEKLATSGTINLDGREWKAAVGWMSSQAYRNCSAEDENQLVEDFLAPAEVERYRSFHRNGRRQQELLRTRILAKRVIRGYLASNRGYNLKHDQDIVVLHVEQGERQGMPYVSVGGNGVEDLSVSLTHCSSMLGAAVGDGCLIGIDVEEVRSTEASFLELFLDHEEIEFMQGSFQRLDLNQKGTLMWCAKEAVGKALGTGFFHGFSAIRFRSGDKVGMIELKLHAELEKYIPTCDTQSRIYYDFHDGVCYVACIFGLIG